MLDPAVFDTLLLAIESGAAPLPAAGPILVLNAEPGPWLGQLPKDRLVLRTSLKPAHDVLSGGCYKVMPPDSVDLPKAMLTIILPPRQRDQARALYARALIAAPEGGVVLSCLPNTLGAKSGEDALAALAGKTESLSKHKCRAFWAIKRAAVIDHALAEDWIAGDSPREIEPGLWSRPGLFSWDHVDAGSEMLADSVPEYTKGVGIDLGAGNGFLSREILAHCPNVESMALVEADYRALSCQEATLAPYAGRFSVHWANALTDLPPAAYDFAVMNPPFHTGRADNHALGRAFIRAASATLRNGGTLWLVANRHLPYEEELTKSFKSHEIIENDAGYKIIRAEGPKRPK